MNKRHMSLASMVNVGNSKRSYRRVCCIGCLVNTTLNWEGWRKHVQPGVDIAFVFARAKERGLGNSVVLRIEFERDRVFN